MNIDEIEAGKIYEDCNGNRYLIINKIKKGVNYFVNYIYVTQEKEDETCGYKHSSVFAKLSDDQTHNITIDIKPIQRVPQPGEVWEAVDGYRYLIAAKYKEFFYFIRIDGSGRQILDYMTEKDLIKFSNDQSHDITLAEKANER